MNKPLAVALALEAQMRGVSIGQVLREAGLETVVSTAATLPLPSEPDLAALLEALTWRRVFGSDKPSARDLTVFQMTTGHIKRLARALTTADKPAPTERDPSGPCIECGYHPNIDPEDSVGRAIRLARHELCATDKPAPEAGCAECGVSETRHDKPHGSLDHAFREPVPADEALRTALANSANGLHNFAQMAGRKDHTGPWRDCSAQPCSESRAALASPAAAPETEDPDCECGEPQSAGIHDPIRTWVNDPSKLHAFLAAPPPSPVDSAPREPAP